MEISLPIGVYHLDPRGVVLAHVSVVTGATGPSREVGRRFFEDIAPCADRPPFRGRFEALALRGRGSESFTYRLWNLWYTAEVRVKMVGTPRGVWLLIAEPELCERYAAERLASAPAS